jgi:L-aminopeptidase/D-esterase-like protein
MKKLLFVLILMLLQITGYSQTTPVRARELGIRFEGAPGKFNAITDVAGVLVGYKTIVKGDGKLVVGRGPVRTGVTVVFPKGYTNDPVPAAYFILNGDGEMTGLASIEEYGFNYGPIGITNTNSVGVVRDAIGAWNIKKYTTGSSSDFAFGLPVVAETFDGGLNDIDGLHVTEQDVWDALDSATTGPIKEGNVGGGTGMRLFRFKGGTGTSSRVIKVNGQTYTVGVLVQANFGNRGDLMVTGVPVGKEIPGLQPVYSDPRDGSVIVIIATDAPLLPSQLKQIAKRATIGIARTGGFGYNSSGDIFLAFSTQAPKIDKNTNLEAWAAVHKDDMNELYKATALATEEAIINTLVAAKTMTGINGNTVFALPQDRLMEIMKKYNRNR